MKKLLFVIVAIVASCFLFSSCSKEDNKIEFSNLTGVSLYKCQVWFRDTEGGDLITYEEVGTVLVGDNAKVKKHGEYCYIYAKDARGNLVMSKDKRAYDGMSFTKQDLY